MAGSLKKVEETVSIDGVPHITKRYFVDSAGKKQCLYEELDGYGRVIKKAMCVDNVFDGLVEEWGKEYHAIISYKEGKKDGLFAEYRNDVLVSEERYQYRAARKLSEWVDSACTKGSLPGNERVHS